MAGIMDGWIKGWAGSGCCIVSDASDGKIRRKTEAVSETTHTHSPITTAKIVTTSFRKSTKERLVIVEEYMCPWSNSQVSESSLTSS